MATYMRAKVQEKVKIANIIVALALNEKKYYRSILWKGGREAIFLKMNILVALLLGLFLYKLCVSFPINFLYLIKPKTLDQTKRYKLLVRVI